MVAAGAAAATIVSPRFKVWTDRVYWAGDRQPGTHDASDEEWELATFVGSDDEVVAGKGWKY